MDEAINEWKDTVLKNFLKKNGEFSISKDQIDHIVDWFKSNEASRYLSRIKRISVAQALEHTEKWVKSLNKKVNLQETMDGLEIVHSFNDGFNVVKILNFDAYKREGAIMGHCVASYYGKIDVEIYSLRDPENNPHCTIELKKEFENHQVINKINQIKGKQNTAVVDKYHSYVLDFLKNSNVIIDEICTHDIRKIDAHVVGRNVFHFDKEKDTTLVLKGNVTWSGLLEKDEVKPHVLKVEGNFTFENCETKAEYALFDEIHIGGDLTLDNINNLQRLANRVYVDGDVELINCSAFLKLGTEVYIGGNANASDCDELKCFGNSGLIQKHLYVIDCEQFQKKVTQQVCGNICISKNIIR